MPKALILVADGSEEIEFVTPYDSMFDPFYVHLEELDVKSAGVQLKNEAWAHMTRNIRIVPDCPALLSLPSQTAHQVFDILILPGGGPGANTFSSSDAVLELITNFRKSGKYVAAICAGTMALVAAEKKLGEGKVEVTSHPSVRDAVEKEGGWAYSEERVVVSGKVITSRGPGTALLFSLTIVEMLLGKEKRAEVTGPMIVAEKL